MKEATWTATEAASPWSRLWSRIRGGCGKHDPEKDGTRLPRAIVLVGVFDDVSRLTRARTAFQEAAFTPTDLVCICGPQRPGSLNGGWAGLYARVARTLTDSAEIHVSGIVSEPTRRCIRQVLAAGGGVVLIRAAHRFPRACEIIRSAGGQVGLQGTVSAA